jgi:hypothetical protein
VNKVNAAQERRVDNMISRLDDATRILQMYSWVCTAVRRQVNSVWWSIHLRTLFLSSAVAGVAAGIYSGRTALVERFGANWQLMHVPVLVGGQAMAGIFYALSLGKLQTKRKVLKFTCFASTRVQILTQKLAGKSCAKKTSSHV